MSYVEKIYIFAKRIRNIINTKLFQDLFFGIGAMFLFFGVMNVYAVDDSPKISPDWGGTKEYYNVASGLDPKEKEEDNMTSHSGQLALNTAWVVFSTIAPEFTVGGENIQSSTTISPDMKGGVLGLTKNAYANIYVNQPRVDVIAHLQDEWVPGSDTTTTSLYAAESGYDTLLDSGIAPLWAKFRDIAYLFFVVIMIIIGFMIMFRSKIGGQTMVTLGNTIPSIIISLIMITFSFAIAGIIIDIGGLLVGVLYTIFEHKSVAISNIGQFYEMFTQGIGGQFVGVAEENITEGLQNIISSPIKTLLNLWLNASITNLMGIFGIILMILGSGIVLVGAIKLLITLYKAYFELILNVVIGPLKILMGTFPGSEAMRINWVKGIARSVLVFPIAYFIVNIPIFLTGAGNMVLSLPEKLTGADLAGTSGGMELGMGEGWLGLLVTFILRVFVLFYASQAPKFAEVIIPATETNRAMGDAMAGARAGMSKVPLVGSLFK